MNSWIKYTYPSLHLIFSFSIFFIEEYSTFIVFQFGLFTLLFKNKKLLYLFYFPSIFFILIKLFIATFYILYFFNLSIFFITLFITQNILKLFELILFSSHLLLLTYIYSYFEEDRYEFYLYLNISDKIHTIDNEIAFILIFLNLIFLFYNTQKIDI